VRSAIGLWGIERISNAFFFFGFEQNIKTPAIICFALETFFNYVPPYWEF